MNTTKLLRGLIAVVLLILVVMFVLSSWGHYRASTSTTKETTETATPTGDGADAEEPEGGTGEASPGQTVVVLTDGLNFRQTPAKDGKLIEGLDKGEKLTYVGTEGDWFKVRTSDGTEGYVTSSDKYTRLQ